MRVAVIHNRDRAGVLNVFGPQNRETYNPRTVELVASALEKGGHTVRVIDGNMHVIERLTDFMPRVMSGDRHGMVFNMAYGIQGVSRYTHLPAMLEMLGVPYVGSNPLAHGLALDKVIAKIVFKNAGLPTPGFWNFATAADEFDDLEFPVIVKPKMEAVSHGIRIVDNRQDLREAVQYIIDEFRQHVLVEEFIPGREFAVGLLGNHDAEILPIVEIDLKGDPNAIQTSTDKLRQPREKICPADLPEEKAEEIRDLVKRAFRSLDLSDFARVDLRMDAEGKLYVLEINSMASLGRTGAYVYAAKTAGYNYDSLINRILDVAAVRCFGQNYATEVAYTVEASEKKPQKLSARVRSYLRSQAQTIEDSLARMVGLSTPPDEVERVNALGEWISKQLRQVGFNTEVHPQTEVGNILHFKNHDSGECDVLLLSHLDSAVPSSGYVSFREDGNRLYGTGIAESKGGMTVALAALRALRFARTVRRVRCELLLTTDETLGGSAGRSLIREAAARAKYVIGLEAGEADGGIVSTRSGRATYRLELVYPKKRKVTESEVLAHLFRRATAIEDLSDPDAGLLVAIRRIEFDAPFGLSPEKAEAAVTVRFNDEARAKGTEQAIREIAKKKSAKGIRLSVSGRVRRPSMPANEATHEFVNDIAKIGDRLNIPVRPVHSWHSAQICLVPDDKPAIDGMGPIGGRERTEGEYVVRSSLVERAALLAMAIHHCAKADKE